MGNHGDRYLWRPDPRGPIYVRFSFRIPGDPKLRRFVKSLGTSSYPEARRIRDRAFVPLLTSLRCAETALDFAAFVVRSAESVLDRDLSLLLDGLAAYKQGVVARLAGGAHPGAAPLKSASGSGSLTWGELSKRYLAHVRKRRATSTAVKYAGQVKVIDGFFGTGTPVAEIDRKKVGEFLSFLEKQDKRRDTTINKFVATVGTIFRFARSKGLLENNPAEGVRIEGAQSESGQEFTHEEADAVVAMTPPNSTRYPGYAFTAFSVIARYTGARLGEIASLSAEDVVDKKGVRCLALRTEKVRSRGGRSYKKEEIRYVPIAPKLSATIDDLLTRRPAGSLFPRCGSWKWKKAHIFGKDFNRVVKKVAPGRSFHSWRHYAISEMLNSEVAREIRMQISGHQDGSVHGVYSHATVRSMLDAVSKIY